MTDVRRLRRAGEDVLRLLMPLFPAERDPGSDDEDVCIVFADVHGYSDFVARGGDDAATGVLAALDECLDAALEGRRGARIVKRLGDGVMIAAPRPWDALRIGARLVDAFDATMRDLGWPLRLRAGAHRGTCRRQGQDYIGYHVNVAARVMEDARGGELLATANALAGVDLERLRLRVEGARLLRAKGVNGALRVFRVSFLPPVQAAASSRGDVGRHDVAG